jgi:hypothetical protein
METPTTGSADAPAIADLSFSEQLTVWAMRCWLAGEQGDIDAARAAKWAFERAEVGEAARDLASFMTVLNSAAIKPVVFHQPGCPHASDDEFLLLAAVGATQWRRADQLHAALSWWLPPAAVRIAEMPLRRYAEKLRGRRLVMRRRAAALTENTSVAIPAHRTLH